MTIQETEFANAEEYDRRHRLHMSLTIDMILRARPYDQAALLPFNELSSGLVVLEESSPEFRERFTVLRERNRRRKCPPLSAHTTMQAL